MLRRIDRILLRVPQLDGAVAYYRDLLGMTLLKRSGNVASFKLGESELVLHSDPDLPAEATFLLVGDLREMYRRRDQLKLRFMAPPAPVSKGLRATVRDPFDNVLLLLDHSTASAGAEALVENAKPPGALFSGIDTRVPVKRDALVRAYESVGRTADDLPYTPHFETFYTRYIASMGEMKPTREEVWRHLLNIRKSGKLPKLGEARSRPPKLGKEDEQRLRELLGKDIGRRDRLPYTERFNALVNEFNRLRSPQMSPHLVWRIVARLAK